MSATTTTSTPADDLSITSFITHITTIAPAASSPLKATLTGYIQISLKQPLADASALYLKITREADPAPGSKTRVLSPSPSWTPSAETLLSVKPEGWGSDDDDNDDATIRNLSAGVHRFDFAVEVPVEWTTRQTAGTQQRQLVTIRAHAQLERKSAEHKHKDVIGPSVPLEPTIHAASSLAKDHQKGQQRAESERKRDETCLTGCLICNVFC
ncbi:hypothetical protein BDZ88DRAFT_411437 [Geranomyces variabilis]|nr:hypothetical protein BDZ88DRAFT_411437 [Geranomyces variabilis]KAJ3136670.1 hypothetical protein HDU90_003046 [Geranomyces variabilis]